MKNNKKLLQILVPLILLAVIGGIWLLKDSQKISAAAQDQPAAPEMALETTEIDLQALSARGLPMLIDFGADACVPCIRMAPALKAVHASTQGKAVVKFLDVWKHSEAVTDFPVQLVPTQFFFQAGGKPYEPSEEIAASIPFTRYSDQDSGEPVYTAHQGTLTEEQMLMILSDMGVTLS